MRRSLTAQAQAIYQPNCPSPPSVSRKTARVASVAGQEPAFRVRPDSLTWHSLSSTGVMDSRGTIRSTVTADDANFRFPRIERQYKQPEQVKTERVRLNKIEAERFFDTTGSTLNKTTDSPPIVVIGPVLPFRGGIAQHTTMLARALARQRPVKIFSFSRLYPRMLFPGADDRDAAYLNHHESHCSYEIDSINPWSWRRVAKQARQLNPQLVLIPWWTFFLAPCFWFFARYFRRHNVDTVFFVHNVVDHEQAEWKRWLAKLTLKNATRYIVHTQQEATQLAALGLTKPVVAHPHPIYSQFPTTATALPRRAGLELLFFGFIRPYKGLDLLLDAMSLLQEEDIFLTVAGEVWGDKQDIIARAGGNVELRLEYLDDRESAALFKRADVIVLPYRNATASGVVPLAYHYNKPVIATCIGGLPDVIVEGKTGWLVNPEDVAGLAAAIRTAAKADLESFPQHIEQLKQRLTWDSLADSVLSGISEGVASGTGNGDALASCARTPTCFGRTTK